MRITGEQKNWEQYGEKSSGIHMNAPLVVWYE